MPMLQNKRVKLMPDEVKNTSDINAAAGYWESYGTFIEMAAHDLRAPLRKLGVLADRLIDKYKLPDNAEVEQYTHRIHTCITEMQSLIDGFAELANATPESLQYSTCDIHQLVTRLLSEYAARIKEKPATIKLTGLPVINGDSHQLQLLFRELIDNAFLFSQNDNPVSIDIQGEKLDKNAIAKLGISPKRDWFRIVVSDNGIGMEPGETERIFQPLARLHGRSGYAGNGLGLALVKRIVDNHGGLVYAESNPGEGTRLHLILPETNIE
jgi:signal transduction histidine kinase